MAAEHFRILKLISPQDGLLSSSDYLAEYEAIVIKPEWARLVRLSGPDMKSIVTSEADFGRKRDGGLPPATQQRSRTGVVVQVRKCLLGPPIRTRPPMAG